MKENRIAAESHVCEDCETLIKVNEILKNHISTLEEQLSVKEKILEDKEHFISLLTKNVSVEEK